MCRTALTYIRQTKVERSHIKLGELRGVPNQTYTKILGSYYVFPECHQGIRIPSKLYHTMIILTKA